jgi:hypothetical protein
MLVTRGRKKNPKCNSLACLILHLVDPDCRQRMPCDRILFWWFQETVSSTWNIIYCWFKMLFANEKTIYISSCFLSECTLQQAVTCAKLNYLSMGCTCRIKYNHSRKNNHKNNCPHIACGTKKLLPGYHRLICSCFDKCRVDIFTKMVFLVSFSYVIRCFSYVPSINIRWIDEGPLENLFIVNSSILPCGVLHPASLHYSFPRRFMISVCHDSNS